MPEMNGRELALRLATRNTHMRILFISGYASEILHSEGIGQGDLEFLRKPFGRSELLHRVREVLDKGQRSKQA